MFYTYVIQSKKDGKFYTGSTNNLRKRFEEHNEGKVFSTKGRGPFELIYYKACIDEQDARTREKYLKSGMGKCYLKNRMKRFLSLTGFTIIELIIVILVLGICLAPMGIVFHSVMVKYAIPETIQVATALAEQEMERVTGLRFINIINEPLTPFSGNFVNYSYEILVNPVPENLAVDPDMKEYKQVEVKITHSLIDALSLITVVTKKENVS